MLTFHSYVWIVRLKMNNKVQLNISIYSIRTYGALLKTAILAVFSRGAKSRDTPLLKLPNADFWLMCVRKSEQYSTYLCAQ